MALHLNQFPSPPIFFFFNTTENNNQLEQIVNKSKYLLTGYIVISEEISCGVVIT